MKKDNICGYPRCKETNGLQTLINNNKRITTCQRHFEWAIQQTTKKEGEKNETEAEK
jgi:hypothetical protein